MFYERNIANILDISHFLQKRTWFDYFMTIWFGGGGGGGYHVDSVSHENIKIKYTNKSSGLKCVKLSNI